MGTKVPTRNQSGGRLAALIAALLLGQDFAEGQPSCPHLFPTEPAVTQVNPCISAYTTKERLKYYLKTTAGPQTLLFSAASAGIGQARNAPSAWQQGMEGYGRRFGSSMAQRTVSGAIRLTAEMLLGEDSRYLPSKKPGIWPRVGDVLLHSIVVHTQSGKRGPPIGVLAGTFGGGLVSRSWHPAGHDRIRNGLLSGTYAFGYHVGANAFREFWPDIRKHLPF